MDESKGAYGQSGSANELIDRLKQSHQGERPTQWNSTEGADRSRATDRLPAPLALTLRGPSGGHCVELHEGRQK
jgi:hypothetical protein